MLSRRRRDATRSARNRDRSLRAVALAQDGLLTLRVARVADAEDVVERLEKAEKELKALKTASKAKKA